MFSPLHLDFPEDLEDHELRLDPMKNDNKRKLPTCLPRKMRKALHLKIMRQYLTNSYMKTWTSRKCLNAPFRQLFWTCELQ